MGDGPWSANNRSHRLWVMALGLQTNVLICTYMIRTDVWVVKGGGQQDLQDGWDGDNPMLFFGGVEWFTLR